VSFCFTLLRNRHVLNPFKYLNFYSKQFLSNNCVNCGIQFGEYHCSICNLWMSASEEPYHCSQCGFCRVGGRGNFTHCNDCNMCIDALLFEEHNCKFGKYMSNCPVCQEDLFSSRMASHEMPCGHAIHWHCFRELASYDIRCPVCKKTAETPDQMEELWNTMAVEIACQPLPDDLARVVDILCNDCDEKSVNQRWHFLGVQCQKCSSFNTGVEKTILVGEEAQIFLGLPSDSAGQNQNLLGAFVGEGAVQFRENLNPDVRSGQMGAEEVTDIAHEAGKLFSIDQNEEGDEKSGDNDSHYCNSS
jgi:RING finger/CHY zinc finger protein 1